MNQVQRMKSGGMSSVSLFSGCLGMDLGLERAGIVARAFVEKDETCRETIQMNRPGVPCFDDVFSVTGAQLARAVGRVDALVGGPPCQSFSTIGRRGAMRDGRGLAMLEYLRILGEVHPRFFVMENVTGILSAEKDGKPLMPWLLSRFERFGYSVGWWKLNANDYGVPQKRMRVIVIGSLEGRVQMPVPSTKTPPTLHDAIGDLDGDPGECARFGPSLTRFLRMIPEGGDWRSLDARNRKLAMGGAILSSGGLTAFYRRLSYDRPCPTLLTSPTQRATTLCHPRHLRPLSVAEYKRVQGFPDDWRLAGSTTQKYRQLGNAVPVALAEAVGNGVTAIHHTRKTNTV